MVGVVAACVLCGCTCTYGGAYEEMRKCVYNNTGECAGVAKAHECVGVCVCVWVGKEERKNKKKKKERTIFVCVRYWFDMIHQ